jgi:hypothetical protein
MPDNTPETYSVLQYAGVIGLSVWGGVVNYLRNRKSREEFSIMELIGEVATSGFAGVITFYLCEYAGLDALFTAATVGVAGHMGGRTIILLERFITRKIN